MRSQPSGRLVRASRCLPTFSDGSNSGPGRRSPSRPANWIAISKTAKSFQFKLARAVTLKRDVDFGGAFDSMVVNWDTAMAELVRLYGR